MNPADSPLARVRTPGGPVPRRILIRGVNWLGDAVMSIPAIIRLREVFPEAHLAMLAPEKLADLWARVSELNEVLTFSAGENPFRVAKRLRAKAFDLALVFPNSPRSALETWLAGIPRRVGVRAGWRGLFLNSIMPPSPGRVPMRKRSVSEIRRLVRAERTDSAPHYVAENSHQIRDTLHLAAALGANPQPVAPALRISLDEVKSVALRYGLGGAVFAAMSPSAQYGPAKRWPADRFISSAVEVHRRCACQWIIIGGPGDIVLANEISEAILRQIPGQDRQPVCRVFAGRTSLGESMAILSACAVLLTNDSGPMHLAAALGTPVVALFGSTSPELTSPGLPGDPRHQILRAPAPCSPCFRRECPIDFRCMRAIRTEHAVSAIERALLRTP